MSSTGGGNGDDWMMIPYSTEELVDAYERLRREQELQEQIRQQEQQYYVQPLVGRENDSYTGSSYYTKQRLRWTPELHDLFVEAVNQLGGPNSATPKQIWSLMDIPDVAIYHIKSHLQKYRTGKISKKLLRRTAAQANHVGRQDGNLQASSSDPASSITNAFGRIGLLNENGAGASATRDQRVQGSSSANTANAVKGRAIATTSSISPIYQYGGTSHSSQVYQPEWYNMLEYQNFPAIPQLTAGNPSMENYPRVSNLPDEFALDDGLMSGPSTKRRCFFDEVDSFINDIDNPANEMSSKRATS